jgi:hypothetical protein
VTDTGLLVQRAVYAGLDALGSVISPDLSACLHVVGDAGPQLYQRRPALTSIGTTEAFSLFGALRDLVDAVGDASGPVTVAGYHAVTHLTRGERSRVLWVVGRRDTPLADDEARVVSDLAAAIGVVVTALDGVSDEQGPGSIRVSVEGTGRLSQAEVWVDEGGTVRAARAEALAPTTAVAMAALAAVDPALKLGSAAEDLIDGERAVLVLARDAIGRTGLGCALCGADPLHAAARAAVQAATAL